MKRRWAIYLTVGILFGVFDFIYLDFLARIPWWQIYGDGPAGILGWIVRFGILNVGLWLLPAIPVALREARLSRSRLRAAGACVSVWCAAVVAYYVSNAAQLAFWGVPGRIDLHISNSQSAYFWPNWASVLRGDILGGMTEWLVVAVVGGAIVGFLTSALYLRFKRDRGAHGEARA